eukprot:363174-Chlamydomonas_euryale.AAC.4
MEGFTPAGGWKARRASACFMSYDVHLLNAASLRPFRLFRKCGIEWQTRAWLKRTRHAACNSCKRAWHGRCHAGTASAG